MSFSPHSPLSVGVHSAMGGDPFELAVGVCFVACFAMLGAVLVIGAQEWVKQLARDEDERSYSR